MSVRAAETLPFTKENVKTWRQNPRRIDIEGVDTPQVDRRLPEKKKVEPKWKPLMGDGKVVSMSPLEYIERIELINRLGSIEKVDEQEKSALDKGYPGILHYPPYSKDSVESIKKGFNSGSEFYMPEIVYRADGTVGDQEGYHRAVAASELGMKKIPVAIYGELPTKYKKNTNYKDEINKLTSQKHNKKSAPSAPDNKQTQPAQTDEFKADISLLNKELLRNAHAGTSFDPEKRAETEKEYFKAEVNSVYNELKGQAKTDKQKAELKDEIAKFQKKYAEKFNDTLASRGRMLSPMITGPANFPTRRNDKAYSSYENKVRENAKFRDKVVAGIGKRWRKESIADAGGERAVLEKKLKKEQENHQQMKDINAIMRKKSSDADKRKQMENIGVSDTLIKDVFKPDFMGRTGFAGFHLQNSNARIKSAKERLALMDKQAATSVTSTIINGVKVVDNTDDNRIQLFFDGKPDDDMRKKLKGSGWRWAPSVGAWQRVRTNNAIDSAKRILTPDTKKDQCEPQSECDELRLTQKLQEME